jgi:hypothetical protein
MTDWATLRHAYGSAEDVPALLATAKAGGDGGTVWDDLWSRLCHQGTVYSASYAALPALAAMTAQHPPAGYVASLHLAAAIVASNDGPQDRSAVRRRYDNELSVLRDLAERNLAHATGDVEFVYGLQALMAFEDAVVWQRHLESVADGELSLQCPGCGDDLLVPLDGAEFNVVSFGDASVSPTPVIPADPPDSGEAARILALARASGRDEVAARVRYLFGRATCPSCGTSFAIVEALA